MKLIEQRQDLRRTITPISLYLDDLQYIIEVAKKYQYQIKLSDNEFAYDTIDEIRQQRGKKTGHLNISIFGESLFNTIELVYKNGALSVYAWNSTNIDRLMWQDISDYLQRKRHTILRLMELITFKPLFVLLIPIGGILFSKNKLLIDCYLTLTVLYGILWLITLFTKHSFSNIYLQKRHEVESFMKRNSDKIILSLIGAIIGFGLKWVFDSLSNFIGK